MITMVVAKCHRRSTCKGERLHRALVVDQRAERLERLCREEPHAVTCCRRSDFWFRFFFLAGSGDPSSAPMPINEDAIKRETHRPSQLPMAHTRPSSRNTTAPFPACFVRYTVPADSPFGIGSAWNTTHLFGHDLRCRDDVGVELENTHFQIVAPHQVVCGYRQGDRAVG
jgi:hypothetical protein